jgi:thiamine biosynthesis lipoprotein
LVIPTLLPALEAAGYDQTFEQVSAGPGQPLPPGSLPAAAGDWRGIRALPGGRSILLPEGNRLDLGGFAKGWAADQAVRRLRARGPALVDAGGDIAVSGPRANGQPWPIAVGDPLHPGGQIAVLRVARGGVATSGRDYRRWRAGGEWRHHIIDSRTGRSAQTDVLSATVAARSALEAETGAKAALILGSVGGLAWLERRSNFAGLLVLDTGELLLSRRMADLLWR